MSDETCVACGGRKLVTLFYINTKGEQVMHSEDDCPECSDSLFGDIDGDGLDEPT